MIKISGTMIEITRGDCQPFTISLTGDDVPGDGADVLFSVKKDSLDSDALIEKKVTVKDRGVSIQIMNADTKNLPFGDYEWDIRFPNMFGENEPYTPMKPARFRIVRVIGNV
jgi:type 1 fimbria pilin